MKTLSLFILTSFFYILGISTLSAANWKVYVAKYKQDKTCAITYTFDDGLAEHSTVAAPDLLGLRFLYGTRGIIQVTSNDLG